MNPKLVQWHADERLSYRTGSIGSSESMSAQWAWAFPDHVGLPNLRGASIMRKTVSGFRSSG